MTRYNNLKTTSILATVAVAAIAAAPMIARTVAKGSEALRDYRRAAEERHGYAMLDRFRGSAPRAEAAVALQPSVREVRQAVRGLDAYESLEIGSDRALAPEVTLPSYAQRT